MSTTPERFQFYSERVYAVQSSTIPKRLRKDSRESTRWSIRQVIGELLRDPGQCPHVAEKSPPLAVYGYAPHQLHEYADTLADLSALQTEAYERRGKTHTRAMKKTTPTLLSAVASYPEPGMEDTPERRRWIAFVLEAAWRRWGDGLRSVIAHVDESHYHLHILVDCEGAPVKGLHMGHAAAAAEPDTTKRGEVYRAGCSAALDWHWREVAGPMGWLRSSPAPRPRASRAKAAAIRQAQLEGQAAELAAAKAKLRDATEILIAQGQELQARNRRMRAMELELIQSASTVQEMRALVEDQETMERRVTQLRNDRPMPRPLWRFFGQ